MNENTYWKPSEIIINRKVSADSVTENIIRMSPNVPIKFVSNGRARTIVNASEILRNATGGMLNQILAGKKVLYIAPASVNSVDLFTMPDERILCPHFNRLKLASNGCFYRCDWCYLKLTYRASRPFITVYAQYDKIKKQLEKRLHGSSHHVIFNSGELADSLALENLTSAAQYFIPWFGEQENGRLFLLTKSTNVDEILKLPHKGHTLVAWSLNNALISRKFEIGAPSLERRIEAARRVQAAGYRLRIRLDPVVIFEGWKDAYSETIRNIFNKLSPERITIGTLRFEEKFYHIRNKIFTTGSSLQKVLGAMNPMFPSMFIPDRTRPLIGKYSYPEHTRIQIFDFVIREIRKYSECSIALCKESSNVWQQVGMDPSHCECVCQL